MADFAARYARAFADVVEQARLPVDQVSSQMADFVAVFDQSRELREVLLNPALGVEARIRVLDALVPRLGLSAPVRNLLAVMIRHERLGALREIREAFRAEMNRRQGISEIEVISARPLDPDERAQMEQGASRLAGRGVRASFREDRSLLGGAVVRIGSTIYDGSVRGRLERMKQQLMAG